MAQVYQPTATLNNHVQSNAPINQPPNWQPNFAMFSGSIEEQRARLEQAKAEAVNQAMRGASIFINPHANGLPAPAAPSLPASAPVQPSSSALPLPSATTAKKRSFVDISSDDDDDDEVIITSGASSAAAQKELIRSPKRLLKGFQRSFSTPSWYKTATSEAENSAVYPGDRPLTLEANGKHEKRVQNASASSSALAKRRLAEVAARNSTRENENRSIGAAASVEEAGRDSPPQAPARNDPIDEEEVEAMFLEEDKEERQEEGRELEEMEGLEATFLVEDEEEDREEEVPVCSYPVNEEELEAILMEPEEEGILDQDLEVEEREQQQEEDEFDLPNSAGELLDMWEEERNADLEGGLFDWK